MFNIGPAELVVIVLVALMVFGPKRLPDIGRTMGRSLQQFREATKEIRQEVKENMGEVDIRKDIANIRRDVMGLLRTDPPVGGATSTTSQDAARTDIEATVLPDLAPANGGQAESIERAGTAPDGHPPERGEPILRTGPLPDRLPTSSPDDRAENRRHDHGVIRVADQRQEVRYEVDGDRQVDEEQPQPDPADPVVKSTPWYAGAPAYRGRGLSSERLNESRNVHVHGESDRQHGCIRG